ncbi:hypothetical protein FISHEDRAFT_76145 [Fistulina hepatica ATCC 64428]|uniref:Peroxisome assembly protein 12 n=1 Tax=Fistulina hepatica ATCC 64428 TaxID=1128425 RepID=A0A0D7A7M2_9AGAR|nr:hypothetical protein FISHEDRAFT_76145 [Fistulina hepatica ATCC 64428]
MEFFSGTGSDPLKPSLFELVAQEQLRDLLQPALKYVLAFLAQRYPRYLLRIVTRHEEFYALLMLVVERHYLRKHNASFAENFYGLKRRRRPFIEPVRATEAVGGIPEGEKLRDRDISMSLIFLVGIPYLRAKALDYYEQLGGGLDLTTVQENLSSRQIRELTDESFKGRMKRLFKRLYPYMNSGFEVWLLISNISYLFGETPFYRPWLAWIGLDIRRLGIEDFVSTENQFPQNANIKLSSQRAASTVVPPRPKTWRKAIAASPKLLLDSLRFLLPTAIFFVKFLEWWYSTGSPARSFSASPLGPAVPPPTLLRPHPQGISFDPSDYGKCPLCHDTLNNPTAMPSGYVFCYRCAYEQVEKQGCCPVTLLPVKMWQLRKVLM